ncbi:prolyl 4-hydroxylase subunit alpha-2-like isoform X3 [Mytilus californianus]|uniref:prolyl 4-hydroxylase subunit alpha-2-like isoform X3 n=1 Tax=Mytilus californianus TaxID=6549 RepID=UPI0022470D4D|nr:prolyl 4-hydroxylase subunit alpha-2-like isoform X3 [Mytilus californianus]
MTNQRYLLLLICVASVVRCELFTSLAHMERALFAEREISSRIKEYVTEEKQRLDALSRLADELETHSSKALENTDFYLGNPVNAYLFVKRFTVDWERHIEDILKWKPNEEFNDKINQLKEYLPTYEDLNGAVAALLRLQDTYKLETEKIAAGDIAGIKTTELSAVDCFEVGRVAYNDEDYYHTTAWMNEAMSRLENEKNKTVNKSEIIDFLAFSVYQQGNVRHALDLTNELLTLVPGHDRALNNKEYYLKMISEKEEKMGETAKMGEAATVGEQADEPLKNEKGRDEYKSTDEFIMYERLCRGEHTHDYKDKHKLVCRYKTNNDPLLLINPAKEEEIYLDPYVVAYHNIISDYELAVIKSIATPKLGRATVHNAKTGKLEFAHYRVSKSAWLRPDDDIVIERVNKRISAVTKLEMDTAEDLQIANYGIGGHYEPHFDFARKANSVVGQLNGNRIATFLAYMSDVEAGGATVFPYIGVKIFPKRGMAAFWYNLYKNGDGIYDTRHAACPVLVGTKWVSNKWIHERGQEFRRPCGLTADD